MAGLVCCAASRCDAKTVVRYVTIREADGDPLARIGSPLGTPVAAHG